MTMYKQYKLKHFFMLVALFVLCLVAWVWYASRKNAPANISDNNVDVSSPYYENPESMKLQEEKRIERGKSEEKSVTAEEGNGSENVVNKTDSAAGTHNSVK